MLHHWDVLLQAVKKCWKSKNNKNKVNHKLSTERVCLGHLCLWLLWVQCSATWLCIFYICLCIVLCCVSGRRPSSWLFPYLVCSLEEVLKHGGSVCWAGLLVLNGFLQVLNSITAFPDFFKLPGQDLCPSLPGQTGLLQAQLTHLHVVFAWAAKGEG